MVQDPNTAEYSRMPQNAVATGLADYVMPVDQMPEALIRYVQHYCINGTKTGTDGTEASDQLSQILAILREGQATFRLPAVLIASQCPLRRIERRMSLAHFGKISEYRVFLNELFRGSYPSSTRLAD